MSTCRCPTCEIQFDPATTRAMPFCSDRCRLVDLGRWLREEHSVPVSPSEDESDEEPSDESWHKSSSDDDE